MKIRLNTISQAFRQAGIIDRIGKEYSIRLNAAAYARHIRIPDHTQVLIRIELGHIDLAIGAEQYLAQPIAVKVAAAHQHLGIVDGIGIIVADVELKKLIPGGYIQQMRVGGEFGSGAEITTQAVRDFGDKPIPDDDRIADGARSIIELVEVEAAIPIGIRTH